jgi:deazaflavin-dependent oxidoreductase (nitroreductase family)
VTRAADGVHVVRDGLRSFATRMASSPVFVRVGPMVVPPVDRLLHRASGGRLTLSAIIVPSMVLTTTGARSGLPRQTPLATHPEDGCWYVVGSNFGRAHHPAWTHNLLANPEATVTFAGRRVPVMAHRLDSDEIAEVWPRLVARWPNYDWYAETSGRELRVFRLDPRV